VYLAWTEHKSSCAAAFCAIQALISDAGILVFASPIYRISYGAGPPNPPDGVNGGSHEGYVKWACTAAQHRGWRAVVLNLRGCNGLDVSSPRG
jgi:hypothetical protein